MEMRIEFKENHCNCHPETCCCFPYIIAVDGFKVAEGSDKQELQRLALYAQLGYLETVKQELSRGKSV